MTDSTIEDLLTGAQPADGVFNAIMVEVQKSLDEQYSKSRITGPEYATVYLGAIQGALAQASQFVIGLRTANAQAALLEAQALTEAQNLLKITEDTALVTAQIALINAQTSKTSKDEDLVDKQIITEIQEALRVTEQTSVLTNEAGLLVNKNLTEIQNTALITAQTNLNTSQKALVDKQALTEVKRELQVIQETAQSAADTNRIGAETTLLGSKNTTEGSLKLKVDAEKTLLSEKLETERAQTLNTRSNGTTYVEGVVGRQNLLYEAQTDGFLRDAEQKLAKIMMDSWGIDKSTDITGLATLPSELNEAGINEVVAKAKTGIGV